MEYVINNDVLEYVVSKAEDQEIIIPDGVTELGGLFDYKSFPINKEKDYINISRVLIPASLKGTPSDIQNAFGRLKGLKECVVDCANPVYESIDGVLFKKQIYDKSLIFYPRGRVCNEYEIPNGVTHIWEGALDSLFYGPHSIVFPPSMKSVDLRFSGIYNAIKHITIYDNLSCEFGRDKGDYCGCTTWLWNGYSQDNLLITVLSMDGQIEYRIPVFVRNASVDVQFGICLACNPINNAKMTEIDGWFAQLKNKNEKLLTAIVRIGWPYMLSQDNRIKYEKYVSRYIKDAVDAVVKSGYLELFEVFVKNRLIKKTAFPEILAMLDTPQYANQKNSVLKH